MIRFEGESPSVPISNCRTARDVLAHRRGLVQIEIYIGNRGQSQAMDGKQNVTYR